MSSSPLGRQQHFADVPELNVAVFAFLLNFVWEFLQAPFFYSIALLDHVEAVRICAAATIGDTGIMLVAFWGIAAAAGTRRWILNPGWRHLAGFIALGVAITVVFERLALSIVRWDYSEAMPVVPLLGVGLMPLLQWMILPPLTAWFVRRQIT